MRFIWTLLILGCTGTATDDDPVDSMDTVDPVDTPGVDTPVVDTPEVDTPAVDTPGDTDIFFDTDPTSTGVFSHTHRVDGSLGDWYAVEQVGETQADGTRTYVSWDNAYFYVAISSPAIATAPTSRHLLLLLGNGTGGAREVPAIGGQSPALPFGAVRVVDWRLDGRDVVHSLADGLWQARAETIGTGGTYIIPNLAAGVVEATFSRGAYQVVGATIDLAWLWVDDTTGAEVSYGAFPPHAIADNTFDPDIVAWYRFRTDATDAPSSYSPMGAP